MEKLEGKRGGSLVRTPEVSKARGSCLPRADAVKGRNGESRGHEGGTVWKHPR